MIFYEKLNGETAKDYAYRVLKDNIMSLNLKPGKLLSEAELAQKLNISRTPVREVLLKLKGERLVEVKPQAGTYISLIDFNLIEQAVFVRYNLERKVLEEASNLFSEDSLLEMEKCLFSQKLILDKENNHIEFHNLDKEFHRLLFKGVNKEEVWDLISNISTHYNRMRLLVDMKKNKQFLIEEHLEYLELIKNKNSDKILIEELISKHIRKSFLEWEALIESDVEIKEYIKVQN